MEISQLHDKVDRISCLPDHVLVNVISLLPTPSAVATCILSKRWKDIWTGIKTLDLSNCSERLKSDQHHISFRNFLDKILSSKDFSSLQLVKFDLSGGTDCVHAIEWVTLLMKRGVKQLELRNIENLVHENFDEAISLSESFYASNELVKLRLYGDILVCFPVSLHFPILKVVCLNDIYLLDGSSVQNLLSGCPILESLSIDQCNGEGNMDLHSRSLRYLSFDLFFWSLCNVFSVSAPNLDDLSLMGLSCSIVVSAPKLRNLFLSDFCNEDNRFGKMPSLVYAYVSIECNRKKVVEILHSVKSSESLRLTESTISKLEDSDQGLPVFSNLIHLEVSMCSWRTVLHILELSPNLKHIVADFDIMEKPVWFCPPHVPDCLRVLEKIEIQWFNGEDVFVLKMMLYILMTAKSLKEIIVKVSRKWEQLTEELAAILEMAPRVSADCDIILY